MAATMPSIMPLGATMSAPARAWLTHCRARFGSVASLSTSSLPRVLVENAAMAVIGVFAEAFVGDEQHVLEARAARRAGPAGRCRRPARRWSRRRPWMRGCRRRMNARMPSSTRGADFIDQAIDAELVIARHRRDFVLDALPGRTNSGRMKSRTESEVSRTRSRRTGWERRRRRRVWGNMECTREISHAAGSCDRVLRSAVESAWPLVLIQWRWQDSGNCSGKFRGS